MTTKKSISAAQRKKDPKAGPHGSFPLDPEHLKAAWDLAGHAKDPAAVRAKVLAYARAHGMMSHLPKSAQMSKAQADRRSRVAQLIGMAFQHETGEGDVAQQQRLIEFAREHDIMDDLPEAAHAFMHRFGMEHDHGDGDLQHTHTIKKAVEVTIKTFLVEKAWQSEAGDTIIEGWVSTEDEDSDHDIVPPEAFRGALDDYLARRGPLSSNHAMKSYPVGHAQRVALVRDGSIFHQATHPTDAADFEHFSGSGTGVYGRYVITEPEAAAAVRKGNIGAFSWVGNLREYEPRAGSGKKYITIDPLLESTVAAYPVNAKARITAIKAYEDELGAAHAVEGDSQTMDLEELLAGAAKVLAEANEVEAPKDAVSKAEVEAMFASFKTDLIASVTETVQKALPVREEGAGRHAVVPADPREDDPATYIVKKAREVVEAEKELSQEDKDLAWGLTLAYIGEGMRE